MRKITREGFCASVQKPEVFYTGSTNRHSFSLAAVSAHPRHEISALHPRLLCVSAVAADECEAGRQQGEHQRGRLRHVGQESEIDIGERATGTDKCRFPLAEIVEVDNTAGN